MAVRIQERVTIAPYTTFHIGGEARYFSEVTSVEELEAAVLFATQKALPLFVLGGGSNVLVSDEGFSGLVVKMSLRGLTYEVISENNVLVTAAAGEVFDDVVADMAAQHLWGLENLSHIPGSVGAAPVQNIGAYGVEVGNFITAVTVFHVPTRTIKIFSHAQCNFGYRDSFFKTPEGKNYVITAVTFCVHNNSQATISYTDLARNFSDIKVEDLSPVMVRDAVVAIRAEKFPDWKVVGTAGSFFKNPVITRAAGEALRLTHPDLPLYDVDSTRVKCSLGYILDKVCGLKGYRVGGVRLYEKQALVVVTDRGTTAREVSMFVDGVAQKVFATTQIVIEREVNYLFG